MSVRLEFNGMLPAAITKFEELLLAAKDLNPQIIRAYDSSAGKDSYFYWGCACQIKCSNMTSLKEFAESLDILWSQDDSGEMAFTNNLDIDDFKTYKVNGNLELTPEIEKE